ncbi:hypothetical protein D3C72_2267600 [compost metagenome]
MGSTNRVKKVPINMPETITTPRPKRLLAPAPEANSSGTRPTTMAAVVIKIGRKRICAALRMAVMRSSRSCTCNSLANSTIRMPCLLIKPIRVTRPICV